MRPLFYAFGIILFAAVLACNGSNHDGHGSLTPKQQADSLEKEVLDGHDLVMPKSSKIPKIQKEVMRLIDSIDKLPAAVAGSAAPYKAELETLFKELDDAHISMEKWMEEFDYDSARSNLEQRIKYLTGEKIKIDKVKDEVLNSIQKADALLKQKF